MVCDHPLVHRAEIRGLRPEGVIASGWFLGVGECVDSLRRVARGELSHGGAFGGSWPYLQREGLVFAPGLPVVVGPSSVAGADGEYQRRKEGVWREGAGIESLFLAADARRAAPGRSFDILWFENAARHLVREGVLEIEDLFAILRVPATPPLLEQILVRPRALPEEVLGGLQWATTGARAEIEVGRPRALSTRECWRDARLVLESRADVRTVQVRGSEVVAETARGNTAIFEFAEEKHGWRLERKAGVYPFMRLTLTLSDEALWLCGVLDPAVDPLAPGMRGRLAFDLRADLVALG